MSQPYDSRFFETLASESLPSAREVVPLVLELIPARSCVDVGCGQGAWLSVLKESGVSVLGCDGQYVDRKSLLIPEDSFVAVDLNGRIGFDRTFDLCISLEVAEHLVPSAAPTFVESLVSLAPCVLFSAAAPFQGGTSHINEQWPAYWADLFQSHGYHWLDPFRSRLWNNRRVEWWYRQNLFLFCSKAFLDMRPDLAAFESFPSDLMIVRPQIFEDAVRANSHPRIVLARAFRLAWARIVKALGPSGRA